MMPSTAAARLLLLILLFGASSLLGQEKTNLSRGPASSQEFEQFLAQHNFSGGTGPDTLEIDLYDFVCGVQEFFAALLVLPVVSAPLTAALPAFTIFVWGRKYRSVWGRLHYSLVTLAGLVFVIFVIYWNLLGIAR